MKICIPGFVLDKGRSGIGSYVVSLVHYLQKNDQKNDYTLLLSEEENDIIPITSKNFSKQIFSSKLSSPLANILWYNTYLPLFARKSKLDIVHIPTIRRIPFFKGAKLLATIHDLAIYSMPEKYSPMRRFYHYHVLSHLVKRCDYITTVSHHSKNDIVKFLGYPKERIEVIYPGVDKDIFFPHPSKDSQQYLYKKYRITSPYIVYVSRIEHPAKNHIRLIQAFEKLKKIHQIPHQLVLAGANWQGADVVKEYQNKSVFSESIVLPGFVSQEDIVKLYSGCDLMVFPSLYEGFGFPVIEAMACGAFVICSDSSSLREIAGNYCELFDPYSVEDIAEKMMKAIGFSDKERRIKNSMEYAATFCWNNYAMKLLELYQRIYASSV